MKERRRRKLAQKALNHSRKTMGRLTQLEWYKEGDDAALLIAKIHSHAKKKGLRVR